MSIYSSTENRTIAELLRWDTAIPELAPFVMIGKLLLAIDQTGQEAWRPLIKDLIQRGASSFVIYSGRHGAMEGCFQDNGQAPAVSPERRFYQEDKSEAVSFATASNVNIEVIDTSFFNQLMYKRRVLTDLSGGHWVIVSWCHSIASMCKVPNNAAPNYQKGSQLWISAQNMTRRRVCDIVREDYSWVPRS